MYSRINFYRNAITRILSNPKDLPYILSFLKDLSFHDKKFRFNVHKDVFIEVELVIQPSHLNLENIRDLHQKNLLPLSDYISNTWLPKTRSTLEKSDCWIGKVYNLRGVIEYLQHTLHDKIVIPPKEISHILKFEINNIFCEFS